MCSYTTSTGSETIENDDGTSTTQTVYYVNVKLKTYADMIVEYSFDDDRIELVEQMMQMFGSASGVTPQSKLSQTEINEFIKDIDFADEKQKSISMELMLLKSSWQTIRAIRIRARLLWMLLL